MAGRYHLPGVLGDIARLAGEDAALNIALRHGGTRLSLPQQATPDTALARLVGMDAAAKICAELGGDRVEIPLAKPAVIRWLRDQGHTVSAIARMLHCNERTVREHANGPGGDARQADLFAAQ